MTNEPNFVIPTAGGYGTTIATISGALLAAFGIFFVNSKDKKKRRK